MLSRLLRLLRIPRMDVVSLRLNDPSPPGVAASPPDDTKPCTFSGCNGVMTVDDRRWASYVTWVCNWNSEHEEILYKEGNPCKPCSVTDCYGMMRFHNRRQEDLGEWPWYATWVCDRDAAHFEVIPEAEYRQMVRCGVIPRWS